MVSNIAEQHQYFVTFQQPYWEFDQDADFKKLVSYISTGIIIQWWAQILNTSFTIENEKDNRMYFVDVNIIRVYNPQTNF